MYRGRLINPFIAVIGRLNVKETAKDPDGGGTLESGYNDTFREPVTFTTAAGERRDARAETCIQVPCQIEDRVWEKENMVSAGNSPGSSMLLVFHFSDLEKLGLVDKATGVAKITPNDRLDSILDLCTRKLVQLFRDPPGLYAVSCTPAGFGIGRKRNLLICQFEERQQGVA